MPDHRCCAGHRQATGDSQIILLTVAGAVAADARSPARSSANAVSGQLIVGFDRKVSSDRQGRRLVHIRGASIRPRSGLAL